MNVECRKLGRKATDQSAIKLTVELQVRLHFCNQTVSAAYTFDLFRHIHFSYLMHNSYTFTLLALIAGFIKFKLTENFDLL